MRDYVIPAVEIIEYLLEDVIASSVPHGHTETEFSGNSSQTGNEIAPSPGEGEGGVGDLVGGGSDSEGDFFD